MSQFQVTSLVAWVLGAIVLTFGLLAMLNTGDWKSGLHQLGMAAIIVAFAFSPQLLHWRVGRDLSEQMPMSKASGVFAWVGLACFGIGYLSA